MEEKTRRRMERLEAQLRNRMLTFGFLWDSIVEQAVRIDMDAMRWEIKSSACGRFRWTTSL